MITPYSREPNELHDYQGEYLNPDDPCIFTHRRIISWDECPHLKEEDNKIERENLIRRFGRNSAYIKSMLFGEFQRGEDFSLIYSEEDIALMREAMLGKNKPIGDEIAAASDTSSGGDGQTLMVRIGTDVVYQERLKGMTAYEHAEHLVGKLNGFGIRPWQFTIDGSGIGADVANYMENRLGYMGIKRAMANTGPTYKFEFHDKFTETLFFLSQILTAGVLKISPNKDLIRQMMCRRFVQMSSGKIKSEPKPKHREREKESPDDLDTLIYLLYDFDRGLIASNILALKLENKKFKTWEEQAQENINKGTRGAFGRLRNMEEARESATAGRRAMNRLRVGN